MKKLFVILAIGIAIILGVVCANSANTPAREEIPVHYTVTGYYTGQRLYLDDGNIFIYNDEDAPHGRVAVIFATQGTTSLNDDMPEITMKEAWYNEQNN